MDIDIDFPKSFKPEKIFDIVTASIVEQNELKPHNAGVYFQYMPTDVKTKLAAIPYKEAPDFGFTKFDMLHLSALDVFSSREEFIESMNKEPNWKLLEEKKFVSNLMQIKEQFEIVYKVKPKSVLDLADVLCLIRPGKIHLLDKYIRNKNAIRPELYTKRKMGDFRKSHAVAYALTIVAQMNYNEKNYTYEPFE